LPGLWEQVRTFEWEGCEKMRLTSTSAARAAGRRRAGRARAPSWRREIYMFAIYPGGGVWMGWKERNRGFPKEDKQNNI
jgi:ribosomal protein L4